MVLATHVEYGLEPKESTQDVVEVRELPVLKCPDIRAGLAGELGAKARELVNCGVPRVLSKHLEALDILEVNVRLDVPVRS